MFFLCLILFMFFDLPVLQAEEEPRVPEENGEMSDSEGRGGVGVTLLLFGSTLFLALV